MNVSPLPSAAAQPRGFRKVAPALVLFVLSPFVAEFLLGNISISAIAALIFLAPMYGGGAVIIREVARRFDRGWPTIVLLALAYGLLEEGILIQTLFNRHYLGLSLLDEAYVPSLGIGGWWTPFVLTLHTVWSISVPIVLTEGLFAERREIPWLGKVGLTVFSVLFVIGGIIIHAGTHRQDPFHATLTQLLSVAALVVMIVALAFSVKKKVRVQSDGLPRPLIVGVLTFLLGLGFMTVHAFFHAWTAVAIYSFLYLVAFAVLTLWSRRTPWSPLHTLAVGGGAMLTYACTAFREQPVIGAKGAVDLIGNSIFAIVAVVLLTAAVRTQKRTLNLAANE